MSAMFRLRSKFFFGLLVVAFLLSPVQASEASASKESADEGDCLSYAGREGRYCVDVTEPGQWSVCENEVQGPCIFLLGEPVHTTCYSQDAVIDDDAGTLGEDICAHGRDFAGWAELQGLLDEFYDNDSVSLRSLATQGFVFCQGEQVPPDNAGSGWDNVMIGGPWKDVFHGGGGNDYIEGHGGNDYLCGGTDSDEVKGNEGSDNMHGGPGNDSLMGGYQGDRIAGGKGQHDLIGGMRGHDTLLGQEGNDTIHDGYGNDSVSSGPGWDDAWYHCITQYRAQEHDTSQANGSNWDSHSDDSFFCEP